jgi:iron complex outermembrane receptor protein
MERPRHAAGTEDWIVKSTMTARAPALAAEPSRSVLERRITGAWFLLLLLGTMLLPLPRTSAAEGVLVTGKVVANTGKPVEGAQVTIVELKRRTSTDAGGAFHIENVPPGRYVITVSSPRYGSAALQALVEEGKPAELAITLDVAVHTEEVVVSGARPSTSSEADLAVTVLDNLDLQRMMQPTLGETLAQTPGVSSTSYSPGASRPVIRGLGGDRIRILEGGIGVGDASNVSEDHAVSTDTLATDRIEIIRGPSTLLYGSNAIGGVVNLLDQRIPDSIGDEPLTGSVDLRYGTSAEEKAGGVVLNGGIKQLGWHLDGLKRKSGDLDTPIGVLDNSDADTKQGTAGVSWVPSWGFMGVSYGRFDTNYGVPTDEMVRIDMEQKRWDLRGEVRSSGFFEALRFRAGRTDYDHAEIESTGAIGTQFLNTSWEGRLEAPHRQVGAFRGTFGFQVGKRDFEAIGEEGFVPPTVTKGGALFLYEEIGTGPVSFDVGARYEKADLSAGGESSLPDRSFSPFSASGGIVWKAGEGYVLTGTVSRAVRAPTAEELYANGPHLATFQFEIGDPNLDAEKSLGVDVLLRKLKGFVTGEVDIFANDFTDFIVLSPTGATVDLDGELVPVFQATQQDARFRGAEAHVDLNVLHRDPHHLQIELTGDYVRAENTTDDTPVTRIPPLRAGIGLRYQGSSVWGLLELRHTSKQDRIAPFETETDGFDWLNASVGCRLFTGAVVHDLVLRGTNLTDKLGRNAVSPLKDVVPLPGRDVSLAYKLTF